MEANTRYIQMSCTLFIIVTVSVETINVNNKTGNF